MEINELLTAKAKQDVGDARRCKSLTIGGTKRGSVTLETHGKGLFMVSGCDVNWQSGEVKAWSRIGTAEEIQAFLTTLYKVEIR